MTVGIATADNAEADVSLPDERPPSRRAARAPVRPRRRRCAARRLPRRPPGSGGPGAAGGVRHVRASGLVAAGSFNEAHILAITQAICRYRAGAGLHRPAVRRARHPRAVRAGLATALEVLAAHGVDVRVDAADGYTPTPAVSHAIIDAQPRPARAASPTASSSRRRTTRPRTAASSTTRPTAARPTRTSPGWIQDGRTGCSGAGARADGVARVPYARARGGRRRTTSSAPTSTTSAPSSTWTRSAAPGSASASTRWAAPASPTGGRSPSGTGST